MMGTPNGTIVVTGASGSIGLATVRALTARQCSIITVDKDPLPEREAELVLDHIEVDLKDDAALGDALASVRSGEGFRHAIAIAGGGDAEELSQDDPATQDARVFTRVVADNLHTAFITIRHVVPAMRVSKGDRSVTLVSSINAFGGYGAPGYSAAKAGLIGLANALATPLGADGIRINCLVLGTVDTQNLRRLAAARGAPLDLDATAARAPLRRVLQPTDVATALVAIAFDMPGLTGASIVLDNGQTHIR